MSTVSINSRPTGFASGSSTPTLRARFKRVAQYRRILKLLVVRDLKVRYAGSAIGYVWTVLDPLLMSVIYWFVFTQVFHRDAGPGFDPFMIYLVSGQLAWSWFNGGVVGLTKALRSEAQMVRSSNVPRELWVLRVIASKGMEYLFGLPVLVIFAVCYLTAPCRYLVLLPLGIVMEGVLILGLGLILAPLTVLFNDLERIVPLVLRVLFYASPVLYSVSLVPSSIRTAFSLNPAVGFLTIAHATFFPAAIEEKDRVHVGGHLEAYDISTHVRNGVGSVTGKTRWIGGHYETHTVYRWDWIWHSALVSLLILAVGVAVFTRLERSVLKEI